MYILTRAGGWCETLCSLSSYICSTCVYKLTIIFADLSLVGLTSFIVRHREWDFMVSLSRDDLEEIFLRGCRLLSLQILYVIEI